MPDLDCLLDFGGPPAGRGTRVCPSPIAGWGGGDGPSPRAPRPGTTGASSCKDAPSRRLSRSPRASSQHGTPGVESPDQGDRMDPPDPSPPPVPNLDLHPPLAQTPFSLTPGPGRVDPVEVRRPPSPDLVVPLVPVHPHPPEQYSVHGEEGGESPDPPAETETPGVRPRRRPGVRPAICRTRPRTGPPPTSRHPVTSSVPALDSGPTPSARPRK